MSGDVARDAFGAGDDVGALDVVGPGEQRGHGGVVGFAGLAAIAPQDPVAAAKEIDRAAQTSTAFAPIELTVRCKDGTDRTVLVSASLLENALAGVHLVALQDITARHDSENARRELEGALRTRGGLR